MVACPRDKLRTFRLGCGDVARFRGCDAVDGFPEIRRTVVFPEESEELPRSRGAAMTGESVGVTSDIEVDEFDVFEAKSFRFRVAVDTRDGAGDLSGGEGGTGFDELRESRCDDGPALGSFGRAAAF